MGEGLAAIEIGRRPQLSLKGPIGIWVYAVPAAPMLKPSIHAPGRIETRQSSESMKIIYCNVGYQMFYVCSHSKVVLARLTHKIRNWGFIRMEHAPSILAHRRRGTERPLFVDEGRIRCRLNP
jgi:hypothetical protein